MTWLRKGKMWSQGLVTLDGFRDFTLTARVFKETFIDNPQTSSFEQDLKMFLCFSIRKAFDKTTLRPKKKT